MIQTMDIFQGLFIYINYDKPTVHIAINIPTMLSQEWQGRRWWWWVGDKFKAKNAINLELTSSSKPTHNSKLKLRAVRFRIVAAFLDIQIKYL